jgi:hypothetical protein
MTSSLDADYGPQLMPEQIGGVHNLFVNTPNFPPRSSMAARSTWPPRRRPGRGCDRRPRTARSETLLGELRAQRWTEVPAPWAEMARRWFDTSTLSRWQHDGAAVRPNAADVLARDAVCLLDVPTTRANLSRLG